MGTLSILAITAILSYMGIAHAPSAETVIAVAPELVILVLTTAVIVTWNGGIKRLGLVNGILFVNLVPVITFMIGTVRGNSIGKAEILGSVITIAAVIINNFLSRGAMIGAVATPR